MSVRTPETGSVRPMQHRFWKLLLISPLIVTIACFLAFLVGLIMAMDG
jgi:hypothetical protein